MVVMILYQSAVFDDIAQLIRESIRQQTGTTISIVNKPMSVSDDKTVYILLGANDLLLDNMPVNYIVWQFEQLSSRWLTDETYLKILRGAQKVLDYSQSNCKELQSKFGIKARFVPVLPMNSLDGSVSGSNNKTIDVLFCGTMNNRRRKIITELKTKGLKVECRSDLWRHKLVNKIKQSRLCLNMHYYPDATLETTRLLTLVNHKAQILSESSTDLVLDEHYSGYVNVNLVEYDQLVNKALELLKDPMHAPELAPTSTSAPAPMKAPQFIFPVELIASNLFNQEQIITNLPEPDNLPFQEANTKDNGSVLVLPVRPEMDHMPHVSIVTITRDRPILFQIVKRNVSLLKYPEDMIEWIIVDDSSGSSKELDNLKLGKVSIKYFHLPEKRSISYKRNFGAKKATHQIIAHMDDDDYYYPESLYSRVKTLLAYTKKGFDCVGVSSYAIYHLIDDYSFKMNTVNISEASMCYYRSFWEKQKFQEDDRGEGYPFLRGRRSQAIVIGYQFCLVAITHGFNATGRLRSLPAAKKNHSIFNSWNYATQRFFTKIYKQLIAHAHADADVVSTAS